MATLTANNQLRALPENATYAKFETRCGPTHGFTPWVEVSTGYRRNESNLKYYAWVSFKKETGKPEFYDQDCASKEEAQKIFRSQCFSFLSDNREVRNVKFQ